MAQVGRESQTPMIGTSPILLQPSDPQWVVTVGAADAADGQRRDRADETRWRQERRLHRLLRRVGRSRLRRTGEGGARGRKVVANERYARADPSVAGQVLKIVAAKPDAVMTGGAGTPGALPYLALAERGYKGRIYGQHGLINADFVRVGGAAAQGSPMPTGPIIVAEQLPDDHPTKKMGLDFRNVFRTVNNEATTDAFSAYSFDAYQVFADAAARALTKSEAGTPAFRQALREAILSTREVVGVHGVYNFKAGNLHGVDERARVIVELHKGNWKLVP
jgi:branched-chain amino acid transport system substrate-binding protein